MLYVAVASGFIVRSDLNLSFLNSLGGFLWPVESLRINWLKLGNFRMRGLCKADQTGGDTESTVWAVGWEDTNHDGTCQIKHQLHTTCGLRAEMAVNRCWFPLSEGGSSSAKILLFCLVLLPCACLGKAAKAVTATRAWGGVGGSCSR